MQNVLQESRVNYISLGVTGQEIPAELVRRRFAEAVAT